MRVAPEVAGARVDLDREGRERARARPFRARIGGSGGRATELREHRRDDAREDIPAAAGRERRVATVAAPGAQSVARHRACALQRHDGAKALRERDRRRGPRRPLGAVDVERQRVGERARLAGMRREHHRASQVAGGVDVLREQADRIGVDDDRRGIHRDQPHDHLPGRGAAPERGTDDHHRRLGEGCVDRLRRGRGDELAGGVGRQRDHGRFRQDRERVAGERPGYGHDHPPRASAQRTAGREHRAAEHAARRVRAATHDQDGAECPLVTALRTRRQARHGLELERIHGVLPPAGTRAGADSDARSRGAPSPSTSTFSAPMSDSARENAGSVAPPERSLVATRMCAG